MESSNKQIGFIPPHGGYENLMLYQIAEIVFDALGLTEEERKEVYWAVAELAKARLDKARNV